ncbi:MAG: TIGR00725 family protein [Myxococcota bacterium]
MRHRIVAVIGASQPSALERRLALDVGAGLARAGLTLLTGGLGGTMEAASEGAKQAGGLVIGVVPGADPESCNSHVDICIATGLGDGRNALIANSADAFVAVGGGLGTLSEIAYALKRNKPVVALSTWKLDASRLADEPWIEVDSADEAVREICKRLPSGGS